MHAITPGSRLPRTGQPENTSCWACGKLSDAELIHRSGRESKWMTNLGHGYSLQKPLRSYRLYIVIDNQTAGVDIVDPNPQDLSPSQSLRVCLNGRRSERPVTTQITQQVLRVATFLINRSFTNTEPQLCIGSSLYQRRT